MLSLQLTGTLLHCQCTRTFPAYPDGIAMRFLSLRSR